jgi:hypothetical protein
MSVSGEVDAKDRLADGAFELLDGSPVASSITDLTDGSIATPISIDEFGMSLAGAPTLTVWTGTTDAGIASGFDCDGWTADAMPAEFSTNGRADRSGMGWSDDGRDDCSSPKRLYCFQIETTLPTTTTTMAPSMLPTMARRSR